MNTTHTPAAPYRGILFDLDGTLLDTAEGVLTSVRYTIDTLGYEPLSDDVLRTFIGPPVKRSLRRVFGLDEEAADRATNIFRDRYKDHDLFKAFLYEGVMELLKNLKEAGYQIGVATLKREDYAVTLLEHFHISDYCDSICGSDFGSKMTKADVIRKCLGQLALKPEEAALIGDTASDGKGAAETGVDFIAVTFGFGPESASQWEEFHPVFTADRVSQIGDFLLNQTADEKGV